MKPFILAPALVAVLAAPAFAGPDAAILDAARVKGAAVARARAAWVEAGKPSAEFRADCTKEIQAATESLAAEKRPEVRRALLVARLYYRRISRETPTAAELAETRREVSATDPAWTLDANLLPEAASWDPKAFGPVLAEARASHPDGDLRRSLLFSHFTEMMDLGTESQWKPSYAALQKDFSGSVEARKAKARVAAESRTASGAPMPALDVPSLEDPTVRFSAATFRGHYVLVDFWASWCPDCVREMPNLHKAWARFKGKGLEILSLSLDRRPEHIGRYRALPASPMPWKHAFLEGGWKNAACDAWGVMSIPKPVLVGPDGKVAAAGPDLRGENLEKTLAKYLE